MLIKLIFIIGLNSFSLYSQINSDTFLNPEKTYAYGIDLMNRKEYYNAITEFKRYLFLGESKTQKEEAELNIGLCYLGGKEFNNARRIFNPLYDHPNPKIRTRAQLRIADTYLYEELNNIKPIIHYDHPMSIHFSTEYYREFIDNNKDTSPLEEEAYYKLITIHMLNFNPLKAQYLLYDFQPTITEYKNKINKLKIMIPAIKNPRKKSETLAVIFSVILPGSGQMYAGDVKEGFIALGVNSLFGLGTYYAFTKSNLLGFIVGYYTLSFYVGNINNAILAVDKYNENQKMQIRQEIVKMAF